MPNRPCKPDADMKWIWQTLLPGLAMPSCGTAGDGTAGTHEKPAPKTTTAPPRQGIRQEPREGTRR